jgi:hypothetical protein
MDLNASEAITAAGFLVWHALVRRAPRLYLTVAGAVTAERQVAHLRAVTREHYDSTDRTREARMR